MSFKFNPMTGNLDVVNPDSGSGLADAPSDGSKYGRLNGAWSVISEGAGAPSWGAITGLISNQTDLQGELDDKQDNLVADTDYLTPATAATTYAAVLGADDNYVTDAQLVVIGNTSGANTGDQTIPATGVDFDPVGTDNSDDNAANTTYANDYRVANFIAGTHYQVPLVADTNYLTPGTAATTYAPVLGADDNYVTDAEKIVIGNTSGANTGDQTIPASGVDFDPVGTDNSNNNAANTTYASDYRAANFVSGTDYEPAKGTDDNFVTDAEKVVIGNTSGSNTGDQTIPATGVDFDPVGTDNSNNNAVNTLYSGLVSNATHSGDVAGSTVLTIQPGAVDLAMLSATGTPSGTTYLRGDNTWASIAGGGDVSKVGTPVDNQIGVWTGDGTIEGDANLTWDGSKLGVGETSPDVTLHVKGSDAGGHTRFERDVTSGTAQSYGCLRVKATNDVDMAEDFGSAFVFEIEDDTSGNQVIANIQGLRGTADNSGKMHFVVYNAGVPETAFMLQSDSAAYFYGDVDLDASTNLKFNGTNILADSAGTMTLSNIDAIDATTETTLEAALEVDSLQGNLSVSKLNSGTGASSSTFWRGDGTWVAPTASVDLKPYCATGSGSQVQAAATQVTISTEQVTDANYSLSSSEITVTDAGTYQISYAVQVDEDGTAGGTRGRVTAYVEDDGVPITQSYNSVYTREASGGTGLSSSFIVTLGASSVIDLWTDQDGTTTPDLSVERAQISIMKLA